jgi:hypothetical protein
MCIMDDEELSLYQPEFFLAWETFVERIEEAFESEQVAAEEKRPLALQQTRYFLANMALATLFKTLGRQKTADKFHLLAEALEDVVGGVAHPLFKVETPTGKAGRRPDTSAVWRTRASVVLALEYILVGAGDADPILKDVAKRYRGQLASLQRPGTDLKSSLRTWIKSFTTDEVRNEVALSSYKDGMRMLEAAKAQYTNAQLKSVGEKLLTTAAKRAESGI